MSRPEPPGKRESPSAALERTIQFEQALAGIAATLMRVPVDAIDAQITTTLATVAEFLGADRSAVTQLDPARRTLTRTHLWVRAGATGPPVSDSADKFPWMVAQIWRDRQIVALSSLDDLPAEATRDRAGLEMNGVLSGALAPMVIEDRVAGALMLATSTHEQRWSPDLVARLRLVGEIIASALARRDAELALRTAAQALQHAIEIEHVVAGIAATLMRVPVDAIDAHIVQVLEHVGDLLGADRASVFELDRMDRLNRTHVWVRPGTPRPPTVDSRSAFPWTVARLYDAREAIALTRLDELPPEAARDRASLERNGVVSGANAPMVVEDRVVGILSLATVTREQSWSPELVARLQLVGSVIGSALARRDAELALRTALTENERLRERLAAENLYLHAELVEVQDFGEIVGGSVALRGTLDKVRQVADTAAPVLLFGETGTGKELLARAIHAQSSRRTRSFIAVNCAALPATLIESELFGHEKGAFTGATQAKAGRFELADQGTLLLDEIGELELPLQAKLLRVLEDGQIQRLGSTMSRKVDVRIIAATNRDLRRDVRDGRFRSDLYYRLSVFPIEVPPLRERREDIPLLVWHFIQSRQRALGRTIRKIPKSAMTILQTYEWPGNVRELQNVIERAMILSEGTVLRIEEALGSDAVDKAPAERRRSTESLRDAERAHIAEVLERCHWTIEGRGQAAERLGLNPSTLRNRMRKLGIKRPT